MRSSTAFAAFIWLTAACAAAEPELYKLGPGDRLQIKISDFRSGMGEAYQWPMFSQANEDFLVGPDGRLSVPVIGLVVAAGRSTAEVSDEIANRLQARAGLTTKPDASVQISRFRPFYVVGAIDKPGEYEYRPGLTVLQAVGIAGGLPRLSADLALGLEKDALASRGDLRALEVGRVSLTARQARVDAEASESETIDFPKELTDDSDPEAARAIREERLLFQSRREGLSKQTAALAQSKVYLASEIDHLRGKGAAIARGLEATQQEYEIIHDLKKKGLSGSTRQLALEQNLAQIQSNQLDVEVAIVRANEDIKRADRDLAEITLKYRNDLMQEAQDVRLKLGETVEKMATARALVRQAEVRSPALLQTSLDAAARPNYAITRAGADGRIEETPARETDRVQPGDVVRVTTDTAPSASRAAVTGVHD
jgi:protein involved in polysaccharide export with SLBB domain